MTDVRIRALDELGAELARVAAEPRRTRGGAARRALVLALAAIALLGGAYAVPPTRAALDDLTSSFAAWVGGDDGAAPGRPIRPEDDAPDWVTESGGRVIAKAAGVELYVSRVETAERGTLLEFGLGDGIIVGNSIDGWREQFDDRAIVVLGPAATGPGLLLEDGRFPLLGVTARSVERVELRYAEGPPLVRQGLHGGFVLLADAWRPLHELVAYDGAGRELDRADVSHIDVRYLCERRPVCR